MYYNFLSRPTFHTNLKVPHFTINFYYIGRRAHYLCSKIGGPPLKSINLCTIKGVHLSVSTYIGREASNLPK
jgi:hypothetical protein